MQIPLSRYNPTPPEGQVSLRIDPLTLTLKAKFSDDNEITLGAGGVSASGLKANGRMMRNLSSANSITQLVQGIDFDSQEEALDKILYLASSPNFSFGSNGDLVFEVGTLNNVDLVMYSIDSGTYPLSYKKIFDASNQAILAEQNGNSVSPFSVTVNGLTKSDYGFKNYSALVTNTKPGAPETVTKGLGFEFRHSVARGYVPANTDVVAMSNSQINALFASLSQNLGSQQQQINGVQNLTKAVLFVPQQLALVSQIRQNGQSSNIVNLFTRTQRNVTKTGRYTTGYNIYLQNNASGSGGVNTYDFL